MRASVGFGDHRMMDEFVVLREASRDLVFEIAKALGLLRLVRALGMTPEPWVREREIRDLHRGTRRIR